MDMIYDHNSWPMVFSNGFKKILERGMATGWATPNFMSKLFVEVFSEMVRIPKDMFIRILTQFKLLHSSFSSAAENSSKSPCSTACLLPFLQPYIIILHIHTSKSLYQSLKSVKTGSESCATIFEWIFHSVCEAATEVVEWIFEPLELLLQVLKKLH